MEEQAQEIPKPYDGPAELPDWPEAELKQLAVDFHKGMIFSNCHVENQEDARLCFFPLALGGLNNHPESYLKSIGLVFEYLSKAGPRSINGNPCFFSMQLLNRSDTTKLFEICKKLEAAEKAALS